MPAAPKMIVPPAYGPALTVIEQGSSAVSWVGLLASLTRSVKEKVPAVVGVPVMVFPVMSSPAGSAPAEIVQVYGVVPPVAVRDCEYAAPTVPFGSGQVVLLVSAGGRVVMGSLIV